MYLIVADEGTREAGELEKVITASLEITSNSLITVARSLAEAYAAMQRADYRWIIFLSDSEKKQNEAGQFSKRYPDTAVVVLVDRLPRGKVSSVSKSLFTAPILLPP